MLAKAGKIKACSLDKIRPEKELERAKAEILRCKLRIREVFQNLDSLLSKGKINECLFDSEGEISSEDIFCATCGKKDVTLDNDIILCDGACDRGFHQNCLNPPLHTEDIPEGDEGWICPACDCKIDCADVINELQGTDLSIGDSWEKVFPEAAAFANGPKQGDAFDLPSDDSEDDDFDPNMAEEHVSSKEEESSEEDEDGGSDSDDSNFVTSSDDSEPLVDNKKVDDLGLPSEDSEDDDYDPAGPDSDKDIQKKQSSSDESDFTSDSDDFCVEIAKSGGHDEVSTLTSPDAKSGNAAFDMEGITAQTNTTNSNLNTTETEMEQNVVLPVSGRRQAEQLDYKKLYDEAYGKASSGSSDDEEWSGKSTPEKGNEEQSEADSSAGKSSRRRIVHRGDELTPQSAQKSLHPDSLHGSVDQKHGGDLTSKGSNSMTRKGQFGPAINQRLHEHFKTEPYPSRAVKESLAQELGLTFRQVSRWFESRRHFTKAASAKKCIHLDYHSTEKINSPVLARMPVKDPEGAVMEKPNGCRNDATSEEMTSGNLNEGCKRDSEVKNGINSGQRMSVAPESNQGFATISKKVGSPKDGSRKNHHKNASVSDVIGSKGTSARDQIPGPNLVDEARKKAIQREMKKKKMGR
ncbi:homeobox protein HOX1A-like isoform X2 [Phragmites australis]|uniref:homeobox protein HOX1A-like isoform X2 n=1 Tax=Phragmites australis TaxID=29695 RepID=UPI002D79D227|nr:homeobox protein HOX1A-like isoform X2 [Phragmites australis]